MSTTLEERVANLEREVTGLKERVGSAQSSRDWRETFGQSADDPGFDEMVRLGREIREQERERSC